MDIYTRHFQGFFAVISKALVLGIVYSFKFSHCFVLYSLASFGIVCHLFRFLLKRFELLTFLYVSLSLSSQACVSLCSGSISTLKSSSHEIPAHCMQ